MLEGYIHVEKELAVKGYKNGLKLKAIKDITYFYAWRLLIIWLVVIQLDSIFDGKHLIFYHNIAFISLWIIASVIDYKKWLEKIKQTDTTGYTAIVDDYGVTIQLDSKIERYSWDCYKSYKEFDDYLQINFANEGMSIIPKSPELFELIEFTKSKLPSDK